MSESKKTENFLPYTPIDFERANATANRFADIVEERRGDLTDILLKYESFEVVEDEIARTLDLLRNLKENEEYFKLRIGEVTAFLPRNQPLYAYSCFVVVPALMASEVHFRIPHSMRDFFADVLKLLETDKLFPNIFVSKLQRLEFLTERSALRVNPKTGETVPVTEAVIFTGLSAHADQLRVVFDRRTLFLANGSGHNPFIVGEGVDVDAAVEEAVNLQFYNQGQDCAAPNSVMVHTSVYNDFIKKLRHAVSETKVGYYYDRSCRIGPISDPNDLVRIQAFLCEHSTWLDSSTPGIINTRDAIVTPTIITKPLSKGGNFQEIFAPVMFVQEYENDSELALYFEDKKYAPNAMYIALYGKSDYVKSLVGKSFNGKILHPEGTILHNINSHTQGIERGTCQYGGYGYGASSISIGGKLIAMPTLPQREIYEYVAKPIIDLVNAGKVEGYFEKFTDIHEKNVQKLLRHLHEGGNYEEYGNVASGPTYLDIKSVKVDGHRYVLIGDENISKILTEPNISFASQLEPQSKEHIQNVLKLVARRSELTQDEFKTLLYAIPKREDATDIENQERQKNFFKIVYQLLFGKDSGPKLTIFLYEADSDILKKLFDI